MSRHTFRSGLDHNFAELTLDVSRLAGGGGADYPHLYWQLELLLQPPKAAQMDYAFRNATAQIYFATGTGQKIADARPIFVNRLVPGNVKHTLHEYLSLEFPLNDRLIAALERQRQGGLLQLRLDISIGVDEFGIIPADEHSKRPALWGLRNIHRLSLQEGFTVTQSHWIERVLPHIGYGVVHVVEFPAAPLEACEKLSHSFKGLTQAQEMHKVGRYDDAVGKCRVALDPFFEYVEVEEPAGENKTRLRRIPQLKKSWETTLGTSTFAWLDGALGSLKDASNRPHHSPNAHYDQFDSQMILAVTTAVVAYVARSTDLSDLES